MPVAVFTRTELERWGEAMGASLHPPALIALSGELGSGKTTLVQALCRGYGVEEPVTSPTFALVHEYRAPGSPVYHIDLFRIGAPGELRSIGWEDALGAHALVCVEWPERAGTALPRPRLAVALEHVTGDPDRRRVTW